MLQMQFNIVVVQKLAHISCHSFDMVCLTGVVSYNS